MFNSGKIQYWIIPSDIIFVHWIFSFKIVTCQVDKNN